MLDQILKSPLFEDATLSQLFELRKFVIKENIWQRSLLSSPSFSSTLQEYKLGSIGNDYLLVFAKFNFIKADEVIFNSGIKDNLLFISEDTCLFEDQQSFLNINPMSMLSVYEDQQLDCDLYFHPYRIHSVYHLFKSVSPNTASYQPFLDMGGVERLHKRYMERIETTLKDGDFHKYTKFYNVLVDFCILSEVVFHPMIFYVINAHLGKFEETELLIEQLKDSLKSIYLSIGVKNIELIRQWLVRDAHREDPNITVHVLLRMMNSYERLKLKGHLGLAILFLEMSEVLRRATEFYFDIKLEEEQKLGDGWYFDYYMKMQFGSTRIIGNPMAAMEVIRYVGLDYSLKAKVYVEGDTEYGFFKEAFKKEKSVQIINLKGQFVEKGITSFLESLKEDIRLHIFSFVVMDVDRKDNQRALEKAISNKNFFGWWLKCDPDFECYNFSPDELYTAYCDYYQITKDEEAFSEKSNGIKSGTDFFRILKEIHNIGKISKTADWGKALYKLKRQSKDKDSQLYVFTRRIRVSLRCSYEYHIGKYDVGVDGILVEKTK